MVVVWGEEGWTGWVVLVVGFGRYRMGLVVCT